VSGESGDYRVDQAECFQDDLRGAITILKDRKLNWNTAHPVQADLTSGLLRLEVLAAYVRYGIFLPLPSDPLSGALRPSTTRLPLHRPNPVT
jgi:hypothetical protein